MCLSYACHTDTFFISLVFLSNPYRILVITKLKKNIPGIFQSVPYLKTIRQTSKRCTRYIPSVIFSGLEQHVPVIFRAYPCYNFFLFRGIRPANEIQQVIDLLFNICIPRHSVHQGQQDFFATGAPVGSLGSPPPRPLKPGTASSCAGAAGAGAADVGGFLGVRASARGLGAFIQLAPAMPSNSS